MHLSKVIPVALVMGIVFFWSWTNYPEVKMWTFHFFHPLLHPGKVQTLESRFSAEHLMEKYKKQLLKNEEYSFLEPILTLHPYLLMEVKYNCSEDKTKEGVILWSLVDGEMVLDTKSWEKTHGFIDCLQARASRDNFKIINALAKYKGKLDRETLLKTLNVENEILDRWIENCKQKNLILQRGNSFRLHMQQPKLSILPETKLTEALVTKEGKEGNQMSRKFRPSQIECIAKFAFGPTFTIRKTQEIFLPVHTILVKNPDGTQMVTYWNALNGKQLAPSYQIE